MGRVAYRGFTASTGKTLAQVVFKRCKHNVARYNERRANSERAQISTLFDVYPPKSDDVVYEFNILVPYRQREQTYPMDVWRLNVKIWTEINNQPAFEVSVQKYERFGKVPAEILRCVKSTYNEIVEGFG